MTDTSDVPDRERLVHDDPELAESIRRGIDEAERGETRYLGSFTQHLDRDGDLLRSAAGKLRANTEGATPGVRDIEITDETVYVATYDEFRVAKTGNASNETAVANAIHYASWPPEAALELADWLDVAAERGQAEETASAVRLALVLLAGTPMADDYLAAVGA